MSSEVIQAFYIMAAVLAVGATVLAFIFITPEKKRATLKKPLQLLHDALNFKFLIVEKIMQALYIFCTAFVILEGFFMLFMFEDRYYETKWYGLEGLLTMILGPIVIRLVYEGVMMSILLVKNVIQINNKLKNQNGDGAVSSGFEVPEVNLSGMKNFIPNKNTAPAQAPAQPPVQPPVQNGPLFCAACGTPTINGHCPNGHC